jgi:hypothetical protein
MVFMIVPIQDHAHRRPESMFGYREPYPGVLLLDESVDVCFSALHNGRGKDGTCSSGPGTQAPLPTCWMRWLTSRHA